MNQVLFYNFFFIKIYLRTGGRRRLHEYLNPTIRSTICSKKDTLFLLKITEAKASEKYPKRQKIIISPQNY